MSTRLRFRSLRASAGLPGLTLWQRLQTRAGRLASGAKSVRLPARIRRAIPPFARTTTFKLTILYSAMIAAFSGILLVYLYYSTVYYIRAESENRITVEFEQLANAYYTGGMERLSQSVFERMTLSGSQFFYYLEDSSGRKIAGHFPHLPAAPPESGMNS